MSEALFNFVNAWSLMFWPLMLSDSKRNRTSKKIYWWTGVMVSFTSALCCVQETFIEFAEHNRLLDNFPKTKPDTWSLQFLLYSILCFVCCKS